MALERATPKKISSETVESPFMKLEQSRSGFRLIFTLLLMVVGAGLATLIVFGMRVPVLASEVFAWFGQPAPRMDYEAGRRAQIQFLTLLYAAPVGLGVFVFVARKALLFIESYINRDYETGEDKQFHME